MGKPWENHGKTMGKWWFYICKYVNMYICIYVYMYVRIYVYMYIHAYTDVSHYTCSPLLNVNFGWQNGTVPISDIKVE